MVSALPLELIIKIVELLFHLPDGRTDLKTLSACSLVCKQWSGLAHPLLLHRFIAGDVVISEGRIWHHPFDAATAFLRMAGNPGAHVRSVHLNITSDESSFTAFVSILSHCPHIYQLTLEGSLPGFSESGQLQQLAALPVRIRALELACSSLISPVLYQLLEVWPGIQFLHIHTGTFTPPPKDRPSFTLYEFSTRRRLPLDVFRWLLPPLQGEKHNADLRILDFWDLPTEEMCNVIAEYAPYVRSLRLSHPPLHGFMDRFTALEEFVMRTSPNHFPMRPLSLPPTIQHLHLHKFIIARRFSEYLRLAINAVKSLPRLWLVTVNQPITQASGYGDLVQLCEEMGIEMNVDPAVTYLSEYLIRVERFPRLHTMESFYRMNPMSDI